MYISVQRNPFGVQENAVTQSAHTCVSVWHSMCKYSLEGECEGDQMQTAFTLKRAAVIV